METKAMVMDGATQCETQSVTVSRKELIRSYHDGSLACEASVSYQINESAMEEFLSPGAQLLAELYLQATGLEQAGEEVSE